MNKFNKTMKNNKKQINFKIVLFIAIAMPEIGQNAEIYYFIY